MGYFAKPVIINVYVNVFFRVSKLQILRIPSFIFNMHSLKTIVSASKNTKQIQLPKPTKTSSRKTEQMIKINWYFNPPIICSLKTHCNCDDFVCRIQHLQKISTILTTTTRPQKNQPDKKSV